MHLLSCTYVLHITCFAVALAAPLNATAPAAALPTVDLGTSIHRAIAFNLSSHTYNFSNIRYAEAPVGDRRFAAPVPVTGRSVTIDDGSVGHICPQATPSWFALAETFVGDYLSGKQYSSPPASNGTSAAPPADPRMSEDCLFLDVIVPQAVFDTGRATAPVVVWIYGGGYAFGEKTGYDPNGLIASSPEPFIFVALNYRLGAFGFLSQPGTPQPGLLDQRLALEWVKAHISRFGGSPSRITVMGESAGGGSALHQITAYGGTRGPVPFQRAVLQSPAFVPQPQARGGSTSINSDSTAAFLRYSNVSSIAEARKLPASTLLSANAAVVGAASYGTFGFGPVVDGDFVPQLPGVLLARGAFDQAVEVLVGKNADEGLLFTSPASNTTGGFDAAVQQRFPSLAPAAHMRLDAQVYPTAAFSGANGAIDRTKEMIADTFVTCNTAFVRQAVRSRSLIYEFAVPPALHGNDIPYTFADGPAAGVLTETASQMQRFLTRFITGGATAAAQGSGLGNGQMLVFGGNVSRAQDDSNNDRCRFWLEAQQQHLF